MDVSGFWRGGFETLYPRNKRPLLWSSPGLPLSPKFCSSTNFHTYDLFVVFRNGDGVEVRGWTESFVIVRPNMTDVSSESPSLIGVYLDVL